MALDPRPVPILLVAGLSFGLAQFGASNYLDYTLTDVFAALGSLVATLLFLQVWRPAADPEFAIAHSPRRRPPRRPPCACLAGMDALGDRDGHRDSVDLHESCRRRSTRDSLAGVGQGGVNHALPR